MVFEFKLPDIGEGVHEGEISRWLVNIGDTIKEDQPMVEVMTDKVTVEITSPVAGVVDSLAYKEGDTVRVGSVIIVINDGASGGAAKTAKSTKAAEAEGNGHAVATKPTAPVAYALPEPMVAAGMKLNSDVGERCAKVLAAPAVRKLARSMGVDLSTVSGSGPRGRIRKQDVLGSSGASTATMARPVSRTASVSYVTMGQEQRLPYKGMRRKIGDHLVKSKQTAPHFTYVEEADMTQLVILRDALAPTAEAQGVKLTYLPFIMKAVIEGLKQFPKLNSTLDEGAQEIVIRPMVNMGVAVATDDGLIVPVVKHADQKSVLEIAAEITQLSQKARQNKLALDEIQGGTFTLTSIGSIGGIFSAPIVNYPEVAIMGIQKIEKRPVVRDDEIVIRYMTYLSISCDHRVVDGAEAALFMKELISWLEEPNRLLLNVR